MSAAPHADGRVLRAGAPAEEAEFAVIALHGRGGWPEDVVGYLEGLDLYHARIVAPAAAFNSWWPKSFLAPIHENAPYVDSALALVSRLLDELKGEGFGQERVMLMGFSQGACLALEAAARTGGRFHSVGALSGGLIGTHEAGRFVKSDLYGHAPKRFVYETPLDGTPVFVGVHERDPHIPVFRVKESAAALRELGAEVDALIYAGQGHGVTDGANDKMRALIGTG